MLTLSATGDRPPFAYDPEPRGEPRGEPNPFRSRGSLQAPTRMLHHDTLPMPDRSPPACLDCGAIVSREARTGRCQRCASSFTCKRLTRAQQRAIFARRSR